MSNLDSFSGLPTDLSQETTEKWSSIIIKIVWPVLVIGVILGIVLWYAVPGELGHDLGALTWCVTAGLEVALLSIRQALLAEQR